MNCDNFRGIGIKERDLIVEEFVESDAGDACVLEVVFLRQVGYLFEYWMQHGRSKFEVACLLVSVS